ncbi:MAG TPA: DNA polymerase III subunit delta [Edaphocola sp.]|nr:DNA polymerase III subunit delta [Edaphocola sp.]
MAKAKKEKVEKVNTLAAYNKIMSVLNSKQYSPIYLLEGEEAYYIDKILEIFNNEILSPEEKDFNLITLYGKESTAADIMGACSQFPMFGNRSIVILREAAQMDKMEALSPYLEHPTATTIFVIDYRGKSTNSKDKWANAIVAGGGVVFKSQGLEEKEVPSWIQQYGANKNLKIDFSIAEKLANNLGNDLKKISNEIEKVLINEPNLSDLNAELVEKYIGISRDFDFFDLPKVIFQNDTQRLGQMLNYFLGNPKSIPLPPVVATFYTFADRIYRCYSVPDDFNNPESRSLYHYRGYASRFDLLTIHKFIAVLNDFSLKAVGINTGNNNSGEVLKEMIGQLNKILYPQGN